MRNSDVQIVTFLTYQQKRILDEANFPIEKLTKEAAESIFTKTDYMSILIATATYCTGINLLTKYGYTGSNTIINDTNTVIDSTFSNSGNDIYPLLNPDTTVLDAICPDAESIIIWEVNEVPINSNNMLQHNLSKILTAMLRVHTYEVVKSTKQFELCILQLNNIVNDKKETLV